MELKKATKEDVAAIAALEARCFPQTGGGDGSFCKGPGCGLPESFSALI